MMTSVRVIRVVLAVGQPLPVYPDEQTSSDSVGMSQTCQYIWLRANESAPLDQRFHETILRSIVCHSGMRLWSAIAGQRCRPGIHIPCRGYGFRARARARPGMTIVVNGRYGPK